jgi:hypothetical protein
MSLGQKFNADLAIAIADSVNGDHVFVNQLLAAVVEAAMKLRRVRAAGGATVDPLADEAAASVTGVLCTVLDIINPLLNQEPTE